MEWKVEDNVEIKLFFGRRINKSYVNPTTEYDVVISKLVEFSQGLTVYAEHIVREIEESKEISMTALNKLKPGLNELYSLTMKRCYLKLIDESKKNEELRLNGVKNLLEIRWELLCRILQVILACREPMTLSSL